MVAETPVEDHAAGSGKRAHGLLDRNWFFEGEKRACVVEAIIAAGPAHDNERHSVGALFDALELIEELRAAVQVAVDNQSVDFRFSDPRQGALRFLFHCNFYVKTA